MEEQNFSTLIEMINSMEVREDDEEYKNAVDLMFDELEARNPHHFAVRQYKKYKLAAGVVSTMLKRIFYMQTFPAVLFRVMQALHCIWCRVM